MAIPGLKKQRKKMTANTAASKKAKGSRFEKYIAKLYVKFLDIDAKRQLLSGGGYLKGDIYKPEHDGWVDECKNAERIELATWWKQTLSQCKGLEKPVLHVTSNNRPKLSIIRHDDFQDLVLEIEDYGDTFPVKQFYFGGSLWKAVDKLLDHEGLDTPAVLLSKEYENLQVMLADDYFILRRTQKDAASNSGSVLFNTAALMGGAIFLFALGVSAVSSLSEAILILFF